MLSFVRQSGKRDSNPRPLAWEANALPTELFPQICGRKTQTTCRCDRKYTKLFVMLHYSAASLAASSEKVRFASGSKIELST